MKDGIGCRRRTTDNANLANTFNTERIYLVILFRDQDDIDLRCVCVDRQEILFEARFDPTTPLFIDSRCLK
jgi:hypothetical protein